MACSPACIYVPTASCSRATPRARSYSTARRLSMALTAVSKATTTTTTMRLLLQSTRSTPSALTSFACAPSRHLQPRHRHRPKRQRWWCLAETRPTCKCGTSGPRRLFGRPRTYALECIRYCVDCPASGNRSLTHSLNRMPYGVGASQLCQATAADMGA